MLQRNKTLALGATLLATALGSAARGDEDAVYGRLTAVEAETVFAPAGFDDNDEAVVLVDGYLPSGCYRLTRPEVAVDETAKTITITPVARFFDVPCIQARVPYSLELQLSQLAAGEYRLAVNGHGPTEALAVAAATNLGPDDFLYAPIDEASVDTDAQGRLVATLAGRFTNSCMALDELRLVDSGKTLQVLPIMKLTAAEPCTAGEFRFKEKLVLPAATGESRRLLHVRSLNGRAVNVIFSN
jgi:hypothetical protein